MLSNGILETTSTTGTGNLTTAAVTGRPRFTDKFTSNATEASASHFYYSILTQDATPQFVESGIGYMSATGTLVRSVVLSTYVSTTYSDTAPSAVSLSGGPWNVICTGEAGSGAGLSWSGMDNSVSALRYAYSAHIPTSGAGITLTVTANRLYFQPFLNLSSRPIDGIFFRNSSGSANVRMALFECNKDGTPGRKLMGSTADLSSAASGISVITTGGPVRPAPGWLYTAFVADAGVVINAHGTGPILPNPMGHDGVQCGFVYGYLANGNTTIADPASAMTSKVVPSGGLTTIGLGVRYSA